MELVKILYDAISGYGEQRIFSDIVQGESPEAIKCILEHCINTIGKSEKINSETFGSIAEGLLHYFLTVSMIQSQRKILFKSIEIDVVVPDTRILETCPLDSIIISFPKTNDIEAIKYQIIKLKKIQPISGNIWIVIEDNIPLDVKVYTLKDSTTFVEIINDLISFSSNKKQSNLKIFRI